MWPPLQFVNDVRKHWGILVTSGAAIGALGIWQSTGHFVPHSVYWAVPVIGLLVAFYRTWLDEHQQVVTLTPQLGGDKRELIRVITVLRAIMQDVSFWLDIVNNKWGSAPEAVKLLPDDWSTIIYQAGKISPELRRQVEAVGSSLTQANSLITECLSMQPNSRDLGLLPLAHRHLSEAAPGLSRVIAEFEAFESSH